MSERAKAVVIGAGVGGLASAASLAQTQKYDVSVYERMSFAGGRFTQHDHDGRTRTKVDANPPMRRAMARL